MSAGGCTLKKTAAHGQPMPDQAPGKSHVLQRGAQARAGFPAGTAACGESRLGQFISEGLHPAERTHAEGICEGLPPMGSTPCWRQENA